MKSAFLDAFSGLSGDMIAGAMLDAGADFDEMRRALASLPLDGYRLAHAIGIAAGGTARPTGPAAPTELPPEAAETIALSSAPGQSGSIPFLPAKLPR